MLCMQVLTSGIFVIFLTSLLSKVEGQCTESTQSMPFAQVQNILAATVRIEYRIDRTLVTRSHPLWCINTRHAVQSSNSEHNKFSANGLYELVYQQPATNDPVNGRTLYVLDTDHYVCSNHTNMKLIPIESTSACGNISSKIVFLNVFEATCPALSCPANGHVRINDTVATYSCNTGYVLNGNETATCTTDFNEKKKVWSSEPPECEPITCEKPSITNGTVTFHNANNSFGTKRVPFGVVASFKCEDGYALNGDSIMTCHYGREENSSKTGKWTGEIPLCEEITKPPSTTEPPPPATTMASTTLPTNSPTPSVDSVIGVRSPSGIGILFAMLVVGLVVGVFVASLVSIIWRGTRETETHPEERPMGSNTLGIPNPVDGELLDSTKI